MTLFNQGKSIQIELCDFVKICIYTLCPTFCYFPHQIPPYTLMQSLTPAQRTCVLELLYFFHHWYKCWFYIQYLLQTISKSVGGHPRKLSPANTQYAIHLITSQKAEIATEVTKTLQDMSSTFFHVKTVQRALRGTGMKAVTKQK